MTKSSKSAKTAKSKEKSKLKNISNNITQNLSKLRIKNNKATSTPFRYSGGQIGDVFGMKKLGKTIGSLVGGIFGSGSYSLKKNSIINGNTSSAPIFGMDIDGSIRVRRREFVQDIIGSTAFNSTSFSINPGLSSTTPWLKGISQNYQEYDLQGYAYTYVPTSGESVSSANTALGTVVMATQYNAYAAAFTSKQDMEATQYTDSVIPSRSAIHGIECAKTSTVLPNKFVRTGAVPAGADTNFYDMGVFTIATVGMQGSYTVGELWVSYDVILKKPIIPSSSLSDLGYSHVTSSGNVNTIIPSALLGTLAARVQGSQNWLNLNPTVAVDAGNVSSIVISEPGQYLVAAHWHATSGTISAPPGYSLGSNLSTGPNCLQAYNSNTNLGYAAADSWLLGGVTVSAAGVTVSQNGLTFTGTTGITAGGYDVFVISLPGGF